MKLLLLLTLLFALTFSVSAQDRAWYWSLGSVAAANALDMHSSWGHRELNPTLGPTFNGHSAAIKIGVQVPFLALQIWMHRHHPSAKATRAFTVQNFAISGAFAAAAAHNYALH